MKRILPLLFLALCSSAVADGLIPSPGISTLSGTDASGALVTVTNGTPNYALNLAIRFGEVLDALDYLKCDGSTDDSSAAQTLINLAVSTRKPIVLPAAACIMSGVQINGAVSIIGKGQDKSRLTAPSGATGAVLTIAVPSSANPTDGNPVELLFRDFTINQVSTAGGGTEDGLDEISGTGGNPSLGVRLVIDNVVIKNVTGQGFSATGFPFYVEGHSVWIENTGGTGMVANSVTDWFFDKLTVSTLTSTADGLVLSGTSNMHFNQSSFYVNRNNIKVFTSSGTKSTVYFTDSIIDLTSQNGALISLQDSTSFVAFEHCHFRYSGTATNNTYSNIFFDPTNVGQIYLDNDYFYTLANPSSSNLAKYNIDFNSTASIVLNHGSVFALGNLNAAGVSSNPAQIGGSYVNPSNGRSYSFQGGYSIISSVLPTGYSITNGTNTVAQLQGAAANNDGGQLTLSSGGTINVQLNAASGTNSFFNNGNFGFGTTTPQAGLDDNKGTFIVRGGLVPTISACGTAPSAATGSSSSFYFTVGTGAVTSCTVTFATTFTTAPNHCVLQPMNTVAATVATTAAYTSVPSTTGVVINGSSLAGAQYGVSCF